MNPVEDGVLTSSVPGAENGGLTSYSTDLTDINATSDGSDLVDIDITSDDSTPTDSNSQESGAAETALAVLGSGSCEREQHTKKFEAVYSHLHTLTNDEFDQLIGSYQPFPGSSVCYIKSLKKRIMENGVHPVIVDENGKVIDGHTRAIICRQEKIPCPIIIKFDISENEKNCLAIEENLARRHLSMSEKRKIFKEWYPGLSGENKRTQDEMAEFWGVSQGCINAWIKKPNIKSDNQTGSENMKKLKKAMSAMASLLSYMEQIREIKESLNKEDKEHLELLEKFLSGLLSDLPKASEPFYQWSKEAEPYIDAEVEEPNDEGGEDSPEEESGDGTADS